MKTLHQIAKAALTRVLAKETDKLSFQGVLDIHQPINYLDQMETEIHMWGIELGIVNLVSFSIGIDYEDQTKTTFENIIRVLKKYHNGRRVPSHIICKDRTYEEGGSEIRILQLSSIHMSEIRMAMKSIERKSIELYFFLRNELNISYEAEERISEPFDEESVLLSKVHTEKEEFMLPNVVKQGAFKKVIKKYYRILGAKITFGEGLSYTYSVGTQIGSCKITISDEKVTFLLN